MLFSMEQKLERYYDFAVRTMVTRDHIKIISTQCKRIMANLEFHIKQKEGEKNTSSEKKTSENILSPANPLSRHNKGYFF